MAGLLERRGSGRNRNINITPDGRLYINGERVPFGLLERGLDRDGYVPPEGHYLSSYEPSLTQRATQSLGGLLGGGRKGRERARKVTSIGEALPVTGDAALIGDAINAYERGQNLEGGLLTALAVPSSLPVVGGLISKAGRPVVRSIVRKLDAPFSNYKIHPDVATELDRGLTVRQTNRYKPSKMISPEDLQGGYVLNLVGDRTNVGEITKLGGRLLNDPIPLDGGMGYMRGKGTGAWASEGNVIKSLSEKVKDADGVPVHGLYVAMSGTGSDFANMTRDVAMRNFEPSMLLKKDIKDFNKRFKSAKAYKKTNKKTGKLESVTDDFPGIESPKLDTWLDKSGTRRGAFFDFMDKREWLEKGFPDVTAARHAIQDPKLRKLPAGTESYGGQSVALLNPTGLMTPTKELKMPHNTYPVDLAGTYKGGFERGVPKSVLFPEWYQGRRAGGKSLSSDNRAFMLSQFLQKTDQEWVDNVMKNLEANPQQ